MMYHLTKLYFRNYLHKIKITIASLFTITYSLFTIAYKGNISTEKIQSMTKGT